MRKGENKASLHKGGLSALEGQRCAKPLTLSRDENINGETSKENVFHMYWPAGSREIQMHLEVWGEGRRGKLISIATYFK